MNFKNILIKNRETFQLIYGIILIILIPFLVVLNTVFIIDKYNTNIDVALQRQSLNVGRSIYALIKQDLDNPEILQKKISNFTKNTEIKEIDILTQENENFTVIASLNKEKIGKILNYQFYKYAWSQPDNNGLATESISLTSSSSEEIMDKPQEERFWIVGMPMSDMVGKKQAILSMKISSKIVDDMTRDSRNSSLFLLAITILIVISFLFIAVRLWDYAVLYKKIKEIDQMKDEFISMASHELRTPITAIRGYISMVLDGSYGEINEEIKNSMKIVQGSADRLAVLIDDLLNVSRIEQGRLKVESTPTDIGNIVQDIIKELSVQARQKNLELNYACSLGKLPLINIDTDRFKQVMINLVGNAIKYTEKGNIIVSIEEKVEGDTLEIKIKDTGIGMSAKEREKLFEKFYRVQNEKTRLIIGTGLGLWITKQIIEMMKGKIMVDSIENMGTQVTLLFPIVKKG